MLAQSILVSLVVAVVVVMAPGSAWAYVGPGAGLGLIGSLIAVVGAILVALLGLFLLPFRMLMKRRKAKAEQTQPVAAERSRSD